MSDQCILTIGIPTYNRPEKVQESLDHMSTALNGRQINVLLVDDGHNPATSEIASHYAGCSGFTFLRNGANLGYARTFCRLFENCETDYLLVLSDDDLLAVENVDRIQEFLATERPAFASPMYRLGDTIYRGEPTTRAVKAKEYISCSGHASGLIYRVDNVRHLLPTLAKRLDEARADAVCYPQTLVVIAILLGNAKAVYIDCVSAFENGNLPSDLADSNGFAYWDYPSRLQQFAAFDEFIVNFPTVLSDFRDEMLRTHRAGFIHRVIYAWGQMDINAVLNFERQTMKNYFFA